MRCTTSTSSLLQVVAECNQRASSIALAPATAAVPGTDSSTRAANNEDRSISQPGLNRRLALKLQVLSVFAALEVLGHQVNSANAVPLAPIMLPTVLAGLFSLVAAKITVSSSEDLARRNEDLQRRLQAANLESNLAQFALSRGHIDIYKIHMQRARILLSLDVDGMGSSLW